MKYNSKTRAACYYPPILSNGEIVIAPTAEGDICYTKEKDFPDFKKAYDGCIYRAGRRAIEGVPNFEAALLSFGTFKFLRGANLKEFEQELCINEGCVRSLCEYSDGARVYSDSVVCQDKNMYVLKKRFMAQAHDVELKYTLCGYSETTDSLISITGTEEISSGATIDFVMMGYEKYTGRVAVFCNRPTKVLVNGREITLTCNLPKNGEICFFICLEDDLYCDDYKTRIDEWISDALSEGGVERQFKNTAAVFEKFFSDGYVNTPDKKLNSIYKTALYNLKCYTTRWSMAVGIYNDSWHGKFFTYDEYHNFIAMLESGRYELAKRVPTFRLEATLDKAIKRATYLTEQQARFPFITDEYGNDAGTNGFWMDHIMQNATVALGAYEYYEYTQDTEFLRRCYRMIRACAKYYTLHMVYQKQDGSYFLGKCTDLERLGSSVENPFLTMCGVIKTLEICAEASEILEEDGEYGEECRRIAEGLRKNLPCEDGRFVPYLNCKQKSIAVFGGKFPFDVISSDDERLLDAWEDFEVKGGKYGNMYAVGNSISPWYALWKAIGYTRLQQAQKAYNSLTQSYASVGCFDEMFEINEPDYRYRPYFSTAAALFVTVANEMLLQSDMENIYLLPAFDDKGEKVEFKLAAKGGALVEARIEEGRISDLKIRSVCGAPRREFNIYFKGELYSRMTSE